eukprot:7700544-Heterocapsa_arctica.AAC.1
MITPHMQATYTENGKRKGAEANAQRRRRSTIESRGKRPTGSWAGNKRYRELWSGTGGKSVHGWILEPLMFGFWTKQIIL